MDGSSPERIAATGTLLNDMPTRRQPPSTNPSWQDTDKRIISYGRKPGVDQSQDLRHPTTSPLAHQVTALATEQII
ncbi:hypothetical protein ACIQOV_26335 [Kitasatospora sp. NPDC091257]|uniref:hypothetical protein n=1 Tax=Kitasatospora sp. NPDC091257 TaxID=3364084 RepID=UPI0037F1304E